MRNLIAIAVLAVVIAGCADEPVTVEPTGPTYLEAVAMAEIERDGANKQWTLYELSCERLESEKELAALNGLDESETTEATKKAQSYVDDYRQRYDAQDSIAVEAEKLRDSLKPSN